MYNVWISVKKAVVGIIFGAVAVGLASVADVIATSNMGADTPAWIHSLWMIIVPTVVGALKGAANWLKNRNLADVKPS